VFSLLAARVRTSERSQNQFISDLHAAGQINEKRVTSKPNENVIALQTYISFLSSSMYLKSCMRKIKQQTFHFLSAITSSLVNKKYYDLMRANEVFFLRTDLQGYSWRVI
jgi:hypothetical protein